MATIAEPATTTTAPGKYDRPRGSLRFDWLMLLVGMWPLIGALIWHSLYGIERDIPAITSPTHMLIILGILLVVAGPLRSAYTRPAAEVRGLAQLPMILSVLLMYTMIT